MAYLPQEGPVRLLSRNGLSFAETFPTIASALCRIRSLRGCIVDGEIVAYEGERVSFSAIKNIRELGPDPKLDYLLFDLLAEDGHDIRQLPLSERKARLLGRTPKGGPVRAIGHTDKPDQALAEARVRGDEGIVAKRADAPYRGERSPLWLKVKMTTQDDFAVVGWSSSKADPSMMGSLALATRDVRGGPLRYAGHVGTGFDRAARRYWAERLRASRAAEPAVAVPRDAARGVRWARPEHVVRVAYYAYTEDGVLRHPSYRGERADIGPDDVLRDR
jgi:bifunctional non-homologous end joining protein LigD